MRLRVRLRVRVSVRLRVRLLHLTDVDLVLLALDREVEVLALLLKRSLTLRRCHHSQQPADLERQARGDADHFGGGETLCGGG